MQHYSVEHWAALATTVVVTAVLLTYVRRGGRKRQVTAAGWVLLLVSSAWALWDMHPALFDVQRSLPLQLSDLARLTASLALITRHPVFIAPTYYWGLTLNTQSILTPDLGYFVSPPLEYAMYWFLHIAVLAAPIVLVWGMGYRPRWSWLRVTAGWSAGWMGVTMLVNALTGSNYGYLNGLPPGPSLLDHLGPWPWYLVTGLGILGVVWAGVMTWPWERLSRADTSGTRRGCVPPSPAH